MGLRSHAGCRPHPNAQQHSTPPAPLPLATEDLVFSMPCRSNGDGNYEVINDFVIDDWLRDKLQVRGWEQLPGRI